MIANIQLIQDIESVAKANNIRCQRSILPRGGQDGGVIQRSRSGVRTVAFACPVRNIHTVTEMLHNDDLASYPELLAAWIETL